jgi:hypothetical protein
MRGYDAARAKDRQKELDIHKTSAQKKKGMNSILRTNTFDVSHKT